MEYSLVCQKSWNKIYDVDQEASRRSGIVMQLPHAKRLSSTCQHQEPRTALQNTLVAAKAMDMPLQRGEALEGIGQEKSVLGRDEQARVAYTDARALPSGTASFRGSPYASGPGISGITRQS